MQTLVRVAAQSEFHPQATLSQPKIHAGSCLQLLEQY